MPKCLQYSHQRKPLTGSKLSLSSSTSHPMFLTLMRTKAITSVLIDKNYHAVQNCALLYRINCLCIHRPPDSKVHEANMVPIWGRQDPGGPRVGPMNLAIWVKLLRHLTKYLPQKCNDAELPYDSERYELGWERPTNALHSCRGCKSNKLFPKFHSATDVKKHWRICNRCHSLNVIIWWMISFVDGDWHTKQNVQFLNSAAY